MQFFTKNSDIAENTPKRSVSELKNSAHRLGLGMLVLVINSFLAPFFFSFIVFVLIGATPDESDAYYIMVLLLNEISAYTFPLIILTAMFRKECGSFIPQTQYAEKPCESIILFLAGVSAGSLGTLLTQLINSVIDRFFGTGEIPEAFEGMNPANTLQFTFFAICICVIAPVCEEYIFRELLLKPMRRFGDFAAALMSGLVFGLYHGNFDQFAYAALLGFFYAVIAIRQSSIIPTIILHAINNFIVTFANYSPDENLFTKAVSTVSSLMFPAGLIAIIAAAVMGLLKFEKSPSAPRGHECAEIILKSPAFIIGLAAMLIGFFI